MLIFLSENGDYMNFNKKTIRYYYWVIIEFFRKNVRLIVISFLTSFIVIVGILSVSPYMKIALFKEEVIGIVGNYDFHNIPDEIVNKISNGLVMMTEKGKIIPVIANSWEARAEGKEYRFHLKNNLLWSDNKKFTANDINYQFKDVRTAIVDDKTVDFYLQKPLGIFPTFLNKPLIKYPLIGVAGFYKTGKIKMSYEYVKELSLVPNTKNLTGIRYKFYKNEDQLINAYKRGEINKMTLYKKSVADTFLNWKNTKINKAVDYSKLLTIFLNGKDKILTNKDIKDALALAVDYKKLEINGEVAKGPIPPISWAYNTDLKSSNYDLETAKKIINKTIESTETAKLNLVTYYEYYDIADSLVENFKGIGLNTELNLATYEQPTSFDLFLAYLKVPIDPDQYYFWHSTQTQSNIGNYNNVKVDKLLEDGRSTVDIEEREKIYYDLQRIMADDPPAIFLYYPYVYTIERK